MTFVEKLTERLIAEESLELMPYRCSEGVLTIGVGRAIETRGITEDEARYLLANDIEIVQRELASAFSWYDDQEEIVQLVLCDMAFNLGLPKLKQFKLMLAAIESGDMEAAASELLDSNYARQVPNRAKRNADMLVGG